MPQITVNQRYRIRRNKEQEFAMKYLISQKLFQTYGQILVISALIGYNNNSYEPSFPTADDPVLMNQFNAKAYDIMNFIAFAHAKKQEILKDYEREDANGGIDIFEKYHIFEGYANAGFPILLDKLGIDPNELEELDQLDLLRRYYRLLTTNGF